MDELDGRRRRPTLRHRVRAGGPDAGSLPLAMVFLLVCTGLAATLTPVTLAQVDATRLSVSRVRALQAAQSALEAGVAAIRGSYSGSSATGDRTRLPCGTSHAAAPGDGGTYRLTVEYHVDRPNAAQPAGGLDCTAARQGATPPEYALLTARGAVGGTAATERTLRAVYPLRLAAETAAGPAPSPTYGPEHDLSIQPRMIFAWSSASASVHICLDALSSSPAAGSKPRFNDCSALDFQVAGYKQNWYYGEDLTIATVGTLLKQKPLCLDAGPAPASGTEPTLQSCVQPTPARQRWFYNNYGNLELARAAGPGPDDLALSGLCLNVANPGTVGAKATLGSGGNCRSSSFSSRQTFSLSTKTGPGWAASRQADCTAAAGYPCTQRQILNYINPSRCVDLYENMIANMECAQHPTLTGVRSTQLWRLPKATDGPAGATGPLVLVEGGSTRCLTAASDFPSLSTCNPRSPNPNQVFHVYGNTGEHVTMYRIRDSRGRCMTHPNNGNANFFWNHANYNWRIRMDACATERTPPERFNHASLLDRQKWNAPGVLPAEGTPSGGATPAPTTSPSPAGVAAVYPLEDLVEL
ncbi:MAG TPA: RICIN domain-containing protein [Pilimelia sp.]|nr:RICIN domain-containing protein [Pilimelia sp.]